MNKLADELLRFLLSVQHRQHYLITVVPGLLYDIIVLRTKFLQIYHQNRSMIFSSHHDVLLNLENVDPVGLLVVRSVLFPELYPHHHLHHL